MLKKEARKLIEAYLLRRLEEADRGHSDVVAIGTDIAAPGHTFDHLLRVLVTVPKK